ncbi:hypothetical protein WAX74_00125 [Psychrobacillus sp. FJAT-51614]|uniref:Uncharacterized protein n=1 Tax=Psychrobacillus mangrovi TaxID=3117745 RepID=A0ABU8EZE4_9BACI
MDKNQGVSTNLVNNFNGLVFYNGSKVNSRITVTYLLEGIKNSHFIKEIAVSIIQA